MISPKVILSNGSTVNKCNCRNPFASFAVFRKEFVEVWINGIWICDGNLARILCVVCFVVFYFVKRSLGTHI